MTSMFLLSGNDKLNAEEGRAHYPPAAGTRWDFTPANGGKQTTIVSPKWLGGNNTESVLAKVRLELNNVSADHRFAAGAALS